MEKNIAAEMLAWWNEAAQSGDFPPDAFARFFAPSAELIANGELRARGIEALATHFQRTRQQCDWLRIVHPPIETFATASRIFVHYRIEAGFKGETMAEEVMGYFAVEKGKITLVNGISRQVSQDSATTPAKG